MVTLKKIDQKLIDLNKLKLKLEKQRAKIQGSNLKRLFRKLTKIGIGIIPEDAVVELIRQEVARVKDSEDELA